MVSPLGARINVRVTPRAGRNGIDGWDGDTLRVRVAAAPEGGKANAAVIALLAKKLAVPKSSITIVGGRTGRAKIVAIAALSIDAIKAALGADA